MKRAALVFIAFLFATILFAQDAIPPAAKKLIKYYPNYVSGFSSNHLLFKDGTRMVWDDGIKNKSFKDLLEKPDLKDMFGQAYTTGSLKSPPAKNFDPGRVRNEAFFMKIYGSTEKQVSQHLTEITWCPKLVGQRIRVTTINGIDKKLILISKELD
ncbi:MAG: hypothetical protein JO080_04900, partial [Mucilaginibacter sp.]|nr:hypothetical protein [Mucilaginibacter sp.]